ncbi:MAG: hypothetical protein KKB50_17980 [Planctomycetes bacterium]|nr:hypothetical protein [Planctomycetota bacterium]
MRGLLKTAFIGVALSVLCVGATLASVIDTPVPDTFEGEVNIGGATLFADFFKAPASTNDFIYADNDGHYGCCPPDQLAELYVGHSTYTWIVQYRGEGSGNGLAQFVDFQLLGIIPEAAPADLGLINRHAWWTELGAPDNPWGCDDQGMPPACCDSWTPLCPSSIDIAVMDVPTRWFVVAGDEVNADWTKDPGQDGYGHNPATSWDTGKGNTLKSLQREVMRETVSLNTNTGNPDENTVYDTPLVWVPITFIANRGTGLYEDVTSPRLKEGAIKTTELQYLFLAGRLSNGANLVAATRDSGSGTRNGAMNCICVDPSWGRGDNLGNKNNDDSEVLTILRPEHQATNCGGSSVMESAVQNRRLAVGYTGLIGGSRSAADANAGKYEILNLINDVRGGTQDVRPSILSVLYNCDPDTGWQIGGNETMATRGDPESTTPTDPQYMDNQTAALYIRNITASMAAFTAVPGGSDTNFMPAEWLAYEGWPAPDAVDCLPDPTDPCTFVANTVNTLLQEWIRDNSTLVVPAFGGPSPANRVPVRNPAPDWPTDLETEDPANYVDGRYNDGSTTGAYADRTGAFTIAGGDTRLAERNQIQCDFNYDGVRDLDDVPNMMAAVMDPRQFVIDDWDSYGAGGPPGDPGTMVENHVIPEVIGDNNGDGNFDARDIRYFADGLAIDPATGKLNRKKGFSAVDLEWYNLTGNNNYFGTTLATGKTYRTSDSRGDVAGGRTPYPGAHPNGYDFVVDAADIDYVCGNFGDWSDVNVALTIDLSCDMDGDLVIDLDDVTELVEKILCTCFGDANLDGDVDASDLATVTANQGQPGGWADGDFNCDGQVNAADLTICTANQGCTQPTFTQLPGDSNCDGVVNGFDIDAFVAALNSQPEWEAITGCCCDFVTVNDANNDGVVNGFDIDSFVALLAGN